MAAIQQSNGTDSSSKPRSNSISQASESSQTAAEFIKDQLELEAEAREALPYQFDTCTRPLGPLRQSLFSCLTCNPPPAALSDPYTPAGVCYSCSISCHGEHTLVELFAKRNFVCDCGTTRLPAISPCSLRLNEATGTKGGVHSEEPAQTNKYNQNYRNRFCGCEDNYDPHQEKGTMFQCMGLGTVEDGGCGEDWWHPECVVGLGREEYKKSVEYAKIKKAEGIPRKPSGIFKAVSVTTEEELANGHSDERRPSITTLVAAGADVNDFAANDDEDDDDDPPLPPGFPKEDDFETFICYKCVEAFPWIKRYAGTPGFLPAVFYKPTSSNPTSSEPTGAQASRMDSTNSVFNSKKRKASDDATEPMTESGSMAPPKRQKSEDPSTTLTSFPETTTLPLTPKKRPTTTTHCKLDNLPSAPSSATPLSLFLQDDFRTHLCHCPTHFPLLKSHPPLLEEEETYEPPLSSSGSEAGGAPSVGTGSLLDRGEAAFSNMDRVRAIEGAMAYAHLKDKLKAFLQPYAESGKAVGAEDIKTYFEKLRGDAQGIQEAAEGSGRNAEDGKGDGGAEGGGRKEQSGY